MTLEPLLTASPAIRLHAVAALAAFVLGLSQFFLRKGTPRHRVVGYAWSASMMVVAAGSFWIHSIKQWQGFSLIHLLSIVVLVTVPLTVHAARTGRIAKHRRGMMVLFLGALVVAGLFTLAPGRIMHDVVFGPARAQAGR